MSVTRDDRRAQLRSVCVALINVPELLRVLKVPYSYVPVPDETGRGSGYLAILIAISFDIRFDTISDLCHEGTNIINGELSHRHLALNRFLFLLRQLLHLL